MFLFYNLQVLLLRAMKLKWASLKRLSPSWKVRVFSSISATGPIIIHFSAIHYFVGIITIYQAHALLLPPFIYTAFVHFSHQSQCRAQMIIYLLYYASLNMKERRRPPENKMRSVKGTSKHQPVSQWLNHQLNPSSQP